MKPRRPYIRAEPGYNPRGGRPPLDVDFVAVCDAIRGAWAGSGETVTSIAVTFGSKIRVWWICNKGPAHEWTAGIGERTRGQGCACCGSKKLSVTNSLVAKYPEIAAQWHPTKNGSLTPDKFFYTSG